MTQKHVHHTADTANTSPGVSMTKKSAGICWLRLLTSLTCDKLNMCINLVQQLVIRSTKEKLFNLCRLVHDGEDTG